MSGRRRRDDPQARIEAVRAAIAALDGQRRLAESAAGLALVSQAKVRRAAADQLQALADAAGVAERAETVAAGAQRAARADGGPDAAQYEHAAQGLRSAQQVLAAAAQPLHDLLASSSAATDQARALLAESRRVLDAQLVEQVRLLREVEAAQVARTVDELRRRPR